MKLPFLLQAQYLQLLLPQNQENLVPSQLAVLPQKNHYHRLPFPSKVLKLLLYNKNDIFHSYRKSSEHNPSKM